MDKIRRIVIKVGTATITEPSGRISPDSVGALTSQIVAALERGIDVAVVSSGAIAAGMEKLGMAERPGDVRTLQAVAAVGQGALVRIYTDLFDASGITAGQVLLTQHDVTRRQQYLNARHTLETLFEMSVVPVINENDTVATEEITFGDNDMLAALVASLVGADLLVLLTDTGGLFTEDPNKSEAATLIKKVERVTGEIQDLGGEAGEMGLGGMSSKLQAAKAAAETGVNVVIADGRNPGTITTCWTEKSRARFSKPPARCRRRSTGSATRGSARANSSWTRERRRRCSPGGRACCRPVWSRSRGGSPWVTAWTSWGRTAS